MPLADSHADALAQVYAQSVFELAKADGGREAAESVLGEIEDILELARGDRMFSEFLATRVIPTEARDASLVRILEGRASGLTLRFLRLLNRKGRLGHLPAIAAAFDDLVQAEFGRVEVDLFTAEAIDEATRDSFRSRLADKLGKEVILHAYVEPAMLGGVKLRIGDQLVDDSLASQLSRMRDRLTTEGTPAVRAAANRAIEGGS
ncbi:MAG: ATP synthase F1 subunit delta [Phycisphaeraceae bacterium]|nr:MAG: ATP synthase F1 subunit delta [Phycisphaeraceae bacterium]